MCGNLFGECLPEFLGLFSDLTFEWAGCTSIPHGIKYTSVLAHGGNRGYLHAHVIQSLGVLEPFAVHVSYCAATADTQNLRLYCTAGTSGTEIVVTAAHHGRCHSRGWWLLHCHFGFIDVAIGQRTFLYVAVHAGAGVDVVVVIIVGAAAHRVIVVVVGYCTTVYYIGSGFSAVDVVVGIDVGVGVGVGAGTYVVIVVGIGVGTGTVGINRTGAVAGVVGVHQSS